MANQDTLTVSVVGVREMMKTIRKIDPELRKVTVRTIKQAAKPIVATAQQSYPDTIMRNWRDKPAKKGRVRNGRGWPAYEKGQATKSIKIHYGGRAPREKQRWRLLRVVQWNAAGAIFDMAGRLNPTGNGTVQAGQFMNNLSGAANGRRASRTIWPAVELHMPQVTDTVLEALRVVERTIQTEIDKTKP